MRKERERDDLPRPRCCHGSKELGLNISKVCENTLKEAVKRLKGIEYGETPNTLQNRIKAKKNLKLKGKMNLLHS